MPILTTCPACGRSVFKKADHPSHDWARAEDMASRHRAMKCQRRNENTYPEGHSEFAVPNGPGSIIEDIRL